MSKRKTRLLREREAVEQMMRDPNYIAGAAASGVPAGIGTCNCGRTPHSSLCWQAENRAAIADTHPKDGDVKQAPLVSGGGAEGNRTTLRATHKTI